MGGARGERQKSQHLSVEADTEATTPLVLNAPPLDLRRTHPRASLEQRTPGMVCRLPPLNCTTRPRLEQLKPPEQSLLLEWS